MGTDIFRPYLQTCMDDESHNDLVLCDARNMPFRPGSFDLVLALNMLEHMEKEEGLELLNEIESVASKQVMLVTGPWLAHDDIHGENPYQEHKCGWSAAEVVNLDYRVWGIRIQGQERLRDRLPRLLIPLYDVLCYGLRPLSYFHADWGEVFLAVKSK